jgi:hypothetical protein
MDSASEIGGLVFVASLPSHAQGSRGSVEVEGEERWKTAGRRCLPGSLPHRAGLAITLTLMPFAPLRRVP